VAEFSSFKRKFCRVHKNQAVNLLQIPIHDQNSGGFINGLHVKLHESRVATEFEAHQGFDPEKNYNESFAAKFLQS